ncbi:MAG: NAD-dependent epimerase/dehydratase family protein, partial [Nitrososphaerota archaeon]|nr:NAD-dependent epimerase/dehydratase family protein [Nitrososphaerota archaeon]
MDNPKILVTGGTGFVGSSLVKTLVERNYAVKCLVKKTSNVVFLKKLNVELVYGDITDKQSLQNALKNVDVVYHIAGILGKWRVPQETYIKIHADGTRTVVNACIEQGVNRLIYCSTSGVLGPIETPPVNEYAPYNPTNAYENAKAQAEKIVLQQKNRLDITIIRPGMVYGPWDMHTLSLFRSIKKGFFFFIGDGKALLHPVFIEDLNQSFLQCLNTSKTIGEVYLIVGERYVTVEEFTRTFLSVLGVKRR